MYIDVTCIHTYVHWCMRLMKLYINTHTHTHTHIYIYIHIYLYAHIRAVVSGVGMWREEETTYAHSTESKRKRAREKRGTTFPTVTWREPDPSPARREPDLLSGGLSLKSLEQRNNHWET